MLSQQTPARNRGMRTAVYTVYQRRRAHYFTTARTAVAALHRARDHANTGVGRRPVAPPRSPAPFDHEAQLVARVVPGEIAVGTAMVLRPMPGTSLRPTIR